MKQAFGALKLRPGGPGLHDFTRQVEHWLDGQDIADGLLTLLCLHTSASLLVQENASPSARRDIERYFAELAPEERSYEHDDEGPDDMPAHLRSALTQTQLGIPVRGGRLLLGTWQGIFLFEHRRDPHEREVALHLIGEQVSLESVRDWLSRHAPEVRLIEAHASTATVADAAAALGVEPSRIAKTLSVRVNGTVLLLVARGDARLDNQKFKAAFGGRPRMLDGEETLRLTGHELGGVCPFGLATPLPVWCDVSLKAFATVYPAAGSRNSSVEIAPDRLAEITGAGWTDVCRSGG